MTDPILIDSETGSVIHVGSIRAIDGTGERVRIRCHTGSGRGVSVDFLDDTDEHNTPRFGAIMPHAIGAAWEPLTD